MKLERIVTLANKSVEIPFRAMERSLRATGCKLPLAVIPYDDALFALPDGSEWWKVEPIVQWIISAKMHPTMRKYQCLTIGGYQFVDSDIVFLRNPEEVLRAIDGFVTSCLHWRNPDHTMTADSSRIYERKTTLWPQLVFNSGQFACDRPLYTVESLMVTACRPEMESTAVRNRFNEQPGVNLLVLQSGIQVTNLTLPPLRMESTWAGDYPGEYDRYWLDPARKPYLIHWAGTKPDGARPIDDLFFQRLSPDEKIEWNQRANGQPAKHWSIRGAARRVKRATAALLGKN